jgi:hypothetical protein
MKTMKIITPVLMALTISTFTACGDSDTKLQTTSSYKIYKSENKNVPLDAEMVALSADTEVKITRNLDSSDSMNVHVIQGAVEVTKQKADYPILY